MTSRINSVELFRKFQPRFSEIVWHADGFQGENLLLAPGYFGHRDPIPPMLEDSESVMHLWWSDTEAGKKDRRPSFDVREGNLAFNFNFDPSKKEPMEAQFERAVMLAIYDGPFRGRRFFMSPRLEVSDYHQFCPLYRIPIGFHTDGYYGPILGLHLGKGTVCNWRFFIPEGPEREAIQAAAELERPILQG